jgi:hypothetical protein
VGSCPLVFQHSAFAVRLSKPSVSCPEGRASLASAHVPLRMDHKVLLRVTDPQRRGDEWSAGQPDRAGPLREQLVSFATPPVNNVEAISWDLFTAFLIQ